MFVNLSTSTSVSFFSTPLEFAKRNRVTILVSCVAFAILFAMAVYWDCSYFRRKHQVKQEDSSSPLPLFPTFLERVVSQDRSPISLQHTKKQPEDKLKEATREEENQKIPLSPEEICTDKTSPSKRKRVWSSENLKKEENQKILSESDEEVLLEDGIEDNQSDFFPDDSKDVDMYISNIEFNYQN